MGLGLGLGLGLGFALALALGSGCKVHLRDALREVERHVVHLRVVI